METYADVIIDISHERLDHTFQYHIPTKLQAFVGVGVSVHVPFGRGNTKRQAYVVDISDTPKIPKEKIKDILDVDTDSVQIESQLIQLAYWMKSHYGSTMTKALRTVIPIKQKQAVKEKKIVHLSCSDDVVKEGLLALTNSRRKSMHKERLLVALLDENSIPWDVLRERLHIPSQTIRSVEKQGMIRVELVRDFRDPLRRMKKDEKTITLNTAQQSAVDTFVRDWDAGKRKPYLLYGVTGSGKTQVYMELLAKVLSEGKQAIVLIPEIALTFQTVMRFYTRFGEGVSILHSKLSPGERYDQFERAKCGDLQIMVGPRSALFTPFSNLGLIIIDEEHENTYKSEQVPKYHARETAIERARLSQAAVVLGSATPSLESFYRTQIGAYQLLRLDKRATGAKLPQCEVVDMRQEFKEGHTSILSRRLLTLMQERLAKQEQIMLFINRRGRMGFVSCRACGQVIKCPHCDVSLSLHNDGKLHCHYCGYTESSKKICPSCGSQYIGTFRAGTQKIEEVVQKAFPTARILRMDADTTRKKNGHEEILSAFFGREADILIGTQMIVKGHDFSGVTLVGILAADQSLNDHDFRCSERTFQLLTQAAGRAGRGDLPGTCLIQTYRPKHYSIELSKCQDYDSFYQKEIAYRQLLQYPPCGHMLLIQLMAEDEALLLRYGKALEQWMNRLLTQIEGVRSSGLHAAGIHRLKDIFRMVMYLKSEEEETLVSIKDRMELQIQNGPKTNVSVYFDFDPVHMM